MCKRDRRTVVLGRSTRLYCEGYTLVPKNYCTPAAVAQESQWTGIEIRTLVPALVPSPWVRSSYTTAASVA